MSTLFLTCEHGGNRVPRHLKAFFTGHEDVLETHRGYDIGALDLFRSLASLADETAHATLSRLCIEMNRTEDHPQLFSAYMRAASPAQRQELLALHRAYAGDIAARIRERISGGREVLQIAVHSFTPVLDGRKRDLDIGLLYDPKRSGERTFCLRWRQALLRHLPGLTVRMNQPYKGTSNGLPTALRHKFPKHYAGVELEVNQRFASNGRMDRKLAAAVRSSLSEALAGSHTA